MLLSEPPTWTKIYWNSSTTGLRSVDSVTLGEAASVHHCWSVSPRLPRVMCRSCPVCYQVKPSSNQVNLASCCVMPPDLTAFAKEFDIQLLTHSDAKGDASIQFSKTLPNSPNWPALCRCFFLKYLFYILSPRKKQW